MTGDEGDSITGFAIFSFIITVVFVLFLIYGVKFNIQKPKNVETEKISVDDKINATIQSFSDYMDSLVKCPPKG